MNNVQAINEKAYQDFRANAPWYSPALTYAQNQVRKARYELNVAKARKEPTTNPLANLEAILRENSYTCLLCGQNITDAAGRREPCGCGARH